MKKKLIMILIICMIFLQIGYCDDFSQTPQEWTYPPITYYDVEGLTNIHYYREYTGEGLRILHIDDFNGTFDDYFGFNHGEKIYNIIWRDLPDAEIVKVDMTEVNDFYFEEDFDIIVDLSFFSSEAQVQLLTPDRILDMDAVKLSPAGNDSKTYKHENRSDKWFTLVGAKKHDDSVPWWEGEVLSYTADCYGGSCSSTAIAAVIVGKHMQITGCTIEEANDWLEEQETLSLPMPENY